MSAQLLTRPSPRHTPLVPEARRRSTRTDQLLVVVGIAFAALVGVDGPGPWPVLRAMTVIAAVASVRWCRDRIAGRLGATALLVVGLAAVVAGAGIGINHLVNDPASAEAVAGTITFVGGLALTTLAAVALIRAAHRWWRLLAVPIGLAVLALGVAPLTLAVFVTNTPPFRGGHATLAGSGLPYEDVSLTTDDGVELAAQYVPSGNGASVIVLGGVSGISQKEIDFARLLHRHGYGALLLSVRGQGDSGGDAMMWGWWGEIDVRAGVDFLTGRSDVVDGRIGAIGMSVGGEQAISAAGADERLRAVVSEGATARGARDEGDPASGMGGLFIRYVDRVTWSAALLMTSADSPTPLRESLAALDGRRALLIAAGTVPWEIDATAAFQAAAPDDVEVWIAPDAGHTAASHVHPAEWEQRVTDFLDRSLAVTDPG